MSEKETVTSPEVIIWQATTDMPGTAHERKSYYMLLRDDERETRFILRLQADGTMVAEPYVVHEYDYDEFHGDYEEEEDEEFYDDDDDDEEEA